MCRHDERRSKDESRSRRSGSDERERDRKDEKRKDRSDKKRHRDRDYDEHARRSPGDDSLNSGRVGRDREIRDDPLPKLKGKIVSTDSNSNKYDDNGHGGVRDSGPSSTSSRHHDRDRWNMDKPASSGSGGR